MSTIIQIDGRARGIPCIIEVTSYTPGHPGRMDGPMEDCEPPEPPEFEWRLLDGGGRYAAWLERGLTKQDIEAIDRRVLGALRGDDE